jgi:hypothetical protein
MSTLAFIEFLTTAIFQQEQEIMKLKSTTNNNDNEKDDNNDDKDYNIYIFILMEQNLAFLIYTLGTVNFPDNEDHEEEEYMNPQFYPVVRFYE